MPGEPIAHSGQIGCAAGEAVQMGLQDAGKSVKWIVRPNVKIHRAAPPSDGMAPLCSDFNVLNLACTYRHWQAVRAQPFKVKGYGLTHFEFDFCDGCPGSDAPGQIRRICRVISFCFFNNDCIAHSTSLESSLFEYAVQSTRRQIVAGSSGDSGATRPARVLKWPMTPSCRDQIPTIALKQSEDFARFHDWRIAGT